MKTRIFSLVQRAVSSKVCICSSESLLDAFFRPQLSWLGVVSCIINIEKDNMCRFADFVSTAF